MNQRRGLRRSLVLVISAVDIRVVRVAAAKPLKNARKPAALTIDFGDVFGVKAS